MQENRKPVIGISCGDLNGIGMEIIMKTFANSEMLELCTPVVFASSKVASFHRKALEMEDFNFHIINAFDQLKTQKANLLNCWKEEVFLELGKENAAVGAYAARSLELACDALEEGKIDALVTAPINKASIQSDQFRFTGHTDYLESRFNAKATMLLVSEEMRMALATVHLPLKEVSGNLTKESLLKKLIQLNETLNYDFHIKKGKIAVLSLNPHAGDGGVIGSEDAEVVAPTVKDAFDAGIMAFGPFPADSFFGARKHMMFDAVLAMYHDQGLVAFKTVSFGKGVNFSANLPVIRTSPDHGTGFDIAGKGVANESSFREAVYLACHLAANRKVSREITSNPLPVKKGKKDY